MFGIPCQIQCCPAVKKKQFSKKICTMHESPVYQPSMEDLKCLNINNQQRKRTATACVPLKVRPISLSLLDLFLGTF